MLNDSMDSTSIARSPGRSVKSVSRAEYNEYGDIELLKYDRNACGDKLLPYLTFVDPKKPEASRDFEVIFVEGIQHQNHVRNGYHIQRVISPPEIDNWHMTVPKKLPRFLRDYQKRVLLVKGPSRNF